ncbi:protein kinase domain protein, partial [Ichthyophthirius multifiliis]
NGDTTIKKYEKGQLLGKGGFAKCFQILNLETKKIMAAKIIPKNTLVKNRARQKLISEIKIHKSLHHIHIVKFEHVFEDNENIYILLELCPHQTLNELIKRRKRLTELEAQCYIVQIVSALKYLHQNLVIHRDLKLGNLFIGEKMEVKLGDFGLATKLEFPGEKKRTICGTPNYIAPEILDGKVGHSYEVDIWSLGVIIYTLLIGKPPFETSDVKTTYKKIKQNNYSFPDHITIAPNAKNLIQIILVEDPTKRPSLDEILAHPFINNGVNVPRVLPVQTLQNPPDSSFLKQYTSNNQSQQRQSQQLGNTELLYNSSRIPPINKEIQAQQQQQQGGLQKCQTASNILQKMPALDQQLDKRDSQLGNNMFSSNANLQIKSTGFDRMMENNNQIPLDIKSNNNVWVCQHVDYSSKYGLGYMLSNGCAGVLFNDNTKIVTDHKGVNFEYIQKVDNTDIIQQHLISDYPKDLKKKVTLLQHFRNYLMSEIQKNNVILNRNNESNSSNSVYLKKWMKTRHAIMFRLSNKIVQVQFADKTEIILNSTEKIVIYFNKKGEKTHYPLADAMYSTNQEMTKRLKYTKEILTHLLANNMKGQQQIQQQEQNIQGQDDIFKDQKI